VRRFLLVGLTGGIATGKSTVTAMLANPSVRVVDADALAREVVEPGTSAHALIVAEFGRDVLQPDGRLDRARLGEIVFADPAKRKRLEGITHPAIRARFERYLAELERQGNRFFLDPEDGLQILYRNLHSGVVGIFLQSGWMLR